MVGYAPTASLIGQKFSTFRATVLAEGINVIRTPAVLILGAGLVSDAQAMASITALTLAFWALAGALPSDSGIKEEKAL